MARLFERFSRGHVSLLLKFVQQGMSQGEIRTDVAPLPLVLSIMALGLLPTVLLARLREGGAPIDALLPPGRSLAPMLDAVLWHGISVPKTD